MLKVRHGPFRPELEDAFAERIRELRAEGAGPIAVVTPSRRMADRLERLLTVQKGMALLDVRFHTFYSLALAVTEGSLGGRRLVGDPLFHDRVVDGLLARDRGAAAAFGGEARPRALAGALRSSLRDLIDAGVERQPLEEHFEGELLRSPGERERLAALLGLAESYERRLAELGVLSPSGLTRLAAEKAEDSPYLRRFRELVYYGFYDLTGLQLAFFETVVSRHPAMLFFPHRRHHPAFRFAEAFFEQKLLGFEAAELGPPAGAALPALAPVLDRLFSAGAPPALRTEGFSVLSASGARDEAWAAAKEILRLVEDEGFDYEDIAVAARTLEPYRAVVAEVFGENAIPFDLACGEPLLRHPLAKCALNLLTLRLRDFPASTVEDLVSSPYFKAARGPKTVSHWRRAIRHLGIHGGWLQWKGKLEKRAGGPLELYPAQRREGDAGYAVPAEDMGALWDLVSGLERELGDAKPGSWSAKAERARAILSAHLSLPAEPSAAEQAAWEAALAAVDSLAVFDLLAETPDWDGFLEVLETKLRTASLDHADAGRGVRVVDAMDSRGESFRAVIVLGLKEKLFPRQVREDPLLRDSVRAALRHPAGYWIAQKSAGHEEERLLFYLLASSARERLICVYPRSDEAGKAQVPSLYLRELCRAAGLPLDESRAMPRQPAAKLERLDPRFASPKEVSLRRALEGGSAGEYLTAIGRDGALVEACLARAADFAAWGKAGPLDGIIDPPKEFLDELLRAGLSPSALDDFAQCPFRFFAGRVLRLGERDESSRKGEFAAWMRGIIYHAVLERLHSGSSGLDEAIESVFRECGWQEMGVYPLLWLSEKRAMTEHLRAFAAWDREESAKSGFEPRLLEKAFEGAFPGKLPASLEGLKIHGRVDRVDRDARGRVRVVDYKTRWNRSGRLSDLVLKGQLHQLPLYGELVLASLGGAATLEGAYLYAIEDSPESGGERARRYGAESWTEDRAAFYARVSASIEAVAAGRFSIKPDDGERGYCSYCDFASICRKSHGPSRARAAAAG